MLHLKHQDNSKEVFVYKSPLGDKIGECHRSYLLDFLQCLCCCNRALPKIVFHHGLPVRFPENIPYSPWWSYMNDVSD